MGNTVEFVSYDGRFPNLCSGTLVLRVNGTERTLPKHCMRSGGSVWFDDGWSEHVEEGNWSIDLPNDLEALRDEIEECVNANVPHGCCGGCV